MRNPLNIREIAALKPDYMGFIFYEKSPRCVLHNSNVELETLNVELKKVGVFVNESIEKILETADKYGLDLVQLHGSETPGFCKNLKQEGVKITKAINIENVLDIEKTRMYANDCCDYFLFDTKTHLHGGSGTKFQWWMLNWYDGEIPFFLSGGISIDDVVKIRETHHDRLYGIDINSKFEIEPGLKDVEKVKQFLIEMKK